MKISIEQILSWRPCGDYDTREKIIAETDEHWPKTPLEIANLDIPINDKLWVLLRLEAIDEKSLHLLACDFAEHVLPIFTQQYPNDDRPCRAIETKRLWLEDKVTDDELRKVKNNAVYAAFDVVGEAAYAADGAGAAAYAAAADYAYTAAYYATKATSDYNTERNWQLERIKEILKEKEQEDKN